MQENKQFNIMHNKSQNQKVHVVIITCCTCHMPLNKVSITQDTLHNLFSLSIITQAYVNISGMFKKQCRKHHHIITQSKRKKTSKNKGYSNSQGKSII